LSYAPWLGSWRGRQVKL